MSALRRVSAFAKSYLSFLDFTHNYERMSGIFVFCRRNIIYVQCLLKETYSKFSFGELHLLLGRKSHFAVTCEWSYNHISANKPPQMKIMNTVIPLIEVHSLYCKSVNLPPKVYIL